MIYGGVMKAAQLFYVKITYNVRRKKMKTAKNKRWCEKYIACFLFAVSAVIAIMSTVTVYAAMKTDGNRTTGQTIDLIPDLTGEPLLNQGWGLWDADQ